MTLTNSGKWLRVARPNIVIFLKFWGSEVRVSLASRGCPSHLEAVHLVRNACRALVPSILPVRRLPGSLLTDVWILPKDPSGGP